MADTALAIDASEGRRRWLKHVEEFRLDDVFERLIPSLAAVNANEALELLIKKLRAVVQIDDEHGGYPGSTRSWCDRIDRDDSRKELPARLAHSVYARARQLAVDPASAVMICARLSAEQSEIFQRILIRLLADIGELVPEYVDRFIASDAALDPPFRATEVALVLRERFNVASDAARRVFVYALERGPNLDEVAWQLRHGVVGEQPVEKIDIETTVKEWQRTRLLWFQDRLPEQLQPLAGRVGVEPKTLSPQDQALAEIGVYIGPVSSFTRTDTSPKTLEELRAMGAEQLVTFLREWDPPAPSSPFGSAEPTVDGLSSVLTDLVSSESTMMEYLVTQGATVDLAPEYLRAIAKGVAKVVAANAEVPWASALKLVVTILTKAQKAIGNPPVIDQTTQPWVWASREALDLVKTAARANAVPAADSDTAWAALGVAIAIGARFDGETEITSSDELISAAVNRFSGEAVETVVEMALAERRRKGSEGPGSEFVTLLDGVVAANASPALAELGRLLPFVLYLTEAWVARSIAPLMADRDLMNPAECPFWAGYLLGQRFFTDTFTVLRPLYLSAAMQVDPSATPARRWSLTEHLAQHAILAMMHGVASGNDADHLLPTILDRVPIQDRKQANWLIYREVTDAGGSNTGVLVPRILAFWDWRLGCLEELDPTNPQRAEEAIGLTWLVLATRLPAVDALPLATRTIALSNGKLALDHEIWERAVEFSSVDPVMAFNFAKPIILAILQSDFVDLPASQISGILSAALHSGNSDTAAAATALIHHLGEHGCDVFGELLTAGKHDDVDG